MMYGICPNDCFQAKTETYYDILRPWNHRCSREYISIWHILYVPTNLDVKFQGGRWTRTRIARYCRLARQIGLCVCAYTKSVVQHDVNTIIIHHITQ